LDPEGPLTVQTRLYVIQHPRGQPQQIGNGTFIRSGENPNILLHSAPTASGTSGAPVLNVDNWRVVGLHTGEEQTGAQLRYATRIGAILTHIQQSQPAIHAAIRAAQP
jgi:hypothetical protein